jgi:hypothetical protein
MDRPTTPRRLIMTLRFAALGRSAAAVVAAFAVATVMVSAAVPVVPIA